MIETYLGLIVNRKDDIEPIQELLRAQKIKAPVFILEFENHFTINFTNDYEYWELENEIIKIFPDYEFTENLGNGRKEIRIEFSRQQSEFSTDNWGRPLENPINQTKYLIKKSKDVPEKFSPQIKVLFEDFDEYYYVNIISGIDKATEQTGYLLLDEFREFDKKKECAFFKNQLFKTPKEAYLAGVNRINSLAEQDFKEYLLAKKKNSRKKKKP